MTSLKNDTIVAIATANGVGSIGIIRLSGADALNIALKLTKKTNLTPRLATLCKIYSLNNEFIDEAILLYFKAPASFTGEDVVEFQAHGGFMVLKLIISQLVKAGAKMAKPGEFSQRAFLNDKMDLAKANAIQSLINAKSEGAVKILARQMRGELSLYVNELRDELVKTLAFVETSIDYADDDLPSDILSQTKNLLTQNHAKLERIVSISKSRQGLIDGFKIAIIGKPNVGKSSILNALLAYERAIISDEAGTTRDRIEESLNIGTHLVRIIDTAGIRKNAGAVESIGIGYSLKAIDEADIILAIFDGSNLSDEQDERILELLKDSKKQIFYILNKSDLGVKFEKNLPNAMQISAKNSTEILVKTLEEYLNLQDSDELILNSNLQITACINAINAISNAINLLNESELELFAYEINSAITSISFITKPFKRDEILDEMFSNFCLGK
ncbi:tRNA uridine-5-carboxymethylaminomethyl(34) synthesis GTPase MnmE [Campylobacter mucosalis]|uniref:tRNA modification GTPase MnmE n=1 Tax=Campylobacter mucosalis CCUG 21559 TaxID=1032067 RepID=A0A6G5QIJ4_9BACT|nr:tRNA uridine-5-carboxymethylaminomethyl(34) synthesis GTPase MnmE [Campylobacter mucosalis]QCD45434.1 5-carboxymethylaminomethyluridine-tRNA synthase MnmEG, GTPase component [Campylobacter mucosalis CCUG 21559]